MRFSEPEMKYPLKRKVYDDDLAMKYLRVVGKYIATHRLTLDDFAAKAGLSGASITRIIRYPSLTTYRTYRYLQYVYGWPEYVPGREIGNDTREESVVQKKIDFEETPQKSINEIEGETEIKIRNEILSRLKIISEVNSISVEELCEIIMREYLTRAEKQNSVQ